MRFVAIKRQRLFQVAIASLLLLGNALRADPLQGGTNDALCVTTAIQSALEKDMTFSDQARHIHVITTDDREVFLLGNVESETERKRVLQVANDFIGDNHLRDQLTVAK